MEELRAIILSALPAPIREESESAELVFVAGEPGLVLVRLRDSSLDVELFGVRWDGQIPVQDSEPFASVSFDRLPKDGTAARECLADIIRAAILIRQASFRRCEICGKPNPPEWLHDGKTCQGCAERVLGVVH